MLTIYGEVINILSTSYEHFELTLLCIKSTS